jgi:hypothetical protein
VAASPCPRGDATICYVNSVSEYKRLALGKQRQPDQRDAMPTAMSVPVALAQG